jgi:hypothetical protein
VLEDLVDLIGLALAFAGACFGHRLHNPSLDGAASIAIGGVMTAVAVLLARESKGLLIGESATPDERRAIRAAASGDPEVQDVRRIITQYLGPDTVLVLMDVVFRPELDGAALGAAVDRMEIRIRTARPSVKHIYIEVESLKDAARRHGATRSSAAPAKSPRRVSMHGGRDEWCPARLALTIFSRAGAKGPPEHIHPRCAPVAPRAQRITPAKNSRLPR